MVDNLQDALKIIEKLQGQILNLEFENENLRAIRDLYVLEQEKKK